MSKILPHIKLLLIRFQGLQKATLLFFYTLATYSSLAQSPNNTYSRLFNKADSLYDLKDFTNASIIGSSAVRLAGKAATVGNLWDVACYWSLAGNLDSAFQYLSLIGSSKDLTMADFINIRKDEDFTSIQKDRRWASHLNKLYKQAEKNMIDISTGIKIKVRDGVYLNATVYKPHIQERPLPVIFSLTPYISDTYHERGVYFAQHDYIYANVDVRGRGASEGEFAPYYNDAKDGYDIVEWFAKQSYCNGKISMWGGSYAGADQWIIAKEFPPHLKTIVPVASAKLGSDHAMNYNISFPYTSQWLTFTGTKTGNLNLFQDRNYWNNKFAERFEKDLPFASLDSLVGYPNKNWKKYIAHPTLDNFHTSITPTALQYAKMNFPILSITGSYDGNQQGALSFYTEFMASASPAARDKHYLIIGPWDHAGTRTPTKVQAGISMGDSSLIDMNNLHWQWYNYALNDSAKPAFLRDKVMYFVTNRNRWKSSSTLEAIGNEKIKFYLNSYFSKEKLLPDSASLRPEITIDNRPAVYIYDPLNKTINGSVIYNSTPFKEETEVSGFFQLNMFIETDVKDVDIRAEIIEVQSNGRLIPLTSHTIRARYRESLAKEKLLVPGEINPFQLNGFNFISRVIEKGSRLRLKISSPNSIYDQKNYCSGGIVAYETAKDAHVATIKVYNSDKHRSILLVPVVKTDK